MNQMEAICVHGNHNYYATIYIHIVKLLLHTFEFFLTIETTLIQLKNCGVRVWNLFLMVTIYLKQINLLLLLFDWAMISKLLAGFLIIII